MSDPDSARRARDFLLHLLMPVLLPAMFAVVPAALVLFGSDAFGVPSGVAVPLSALAAAAGLFGVGIPLYTRWRRQRGSRW